MNKELIEKIIVYNYNEYGAEYGDALVDLKHENEWLHHIIKEVREYVLQHCEIIRFENEDKVGKVDGTQLLEILDKENR